MFEYLSRAEGASYVEEIARLAGAFSAFPDVDAIEPEDVVHAVLWISSSAARYVTGTAFTLDAGFTIK
jgi:NAD(P)-dependent dehydrogenase (short-subunit alcohol dehydrogenase family)